MFQQLEMFQRASLEWLILCLLAPPRCRLTFQLNSLEKVEREQQALIEKLSNLDWCGPAAKRSCCRHHGRCSLNRIYTLATKGAGMIWHDPNHNLPVLDIFQHIPHVLICTFLWTTFVVSWYYMAQPRQQRDVIVFAESLTS